MANVIIAQPDWVTQTAAVIATVAVSGGSWRAALPLANLLKPGLGRVARSTNVTLASTKFVVDLGKARDVRVFALPRLPNATRNCRYRVRAYNLADLSDTPSGDTSWKDLFPDLYPLGSVDWGDPSIFSDRPDAELALLFPQPALHVFDMLGLYARYFLVELDDTGNPDGYLDVPRVFIAPGYQPTINMDYGASVQVIDPAQVQRTRGGGIIAGSEPRYRMATFRLDEEQDEAYANIHDAHMRGGISAPVFFVRDHEDLGNLGRTSFLGRRAELGALEATAFDRTACNFKIEEVMD